MQQTSRVAHKKKEAKNAGKTRADRHSKKPHSPLPFGRGPDPWRCHGEVFNARGNLPIGQIVNVDEVFDHSMGRFALWANCFI